MLNYRIISLSIFFLCLVSLANAQSFYVSSSEGNDENDGLSIQSPFKTLDKLNSLVFNEGDSIFFKSGDYWQGMFWIKGSGSSLNPIVIDVYGGDNKPVIDGYGYQASILIFNDQNIEINNLEITNSFSHIDQNISTISGTNSKFICQWA